MSEKVKQVTYTYLVLECLKERNDYVSYDDLYIYVRETRYEVTFSHISAACFHLKKHKAADFVIDSDGKVFWYLTPDTDDRTRTIDERVPESKPRKRKKGYKRRITVMIDGVNCENVDGRPADHVPSASHGRARRDSHAHRHDASRKVDRRISA